jgi:cell division protein FtsB
MRPESLDPDMIEERARRALNVARADDIVILRNTAR